MKFVNLKIVCILLLLLKHFKLVCEDKGFELVKHNTYNTDFPESIYRKNEVNVIVRLNAPILEHKQFTITVIISSKQKKEWTFPAIMDEKVFEIFDLFLDSSKK